MKILILSDLHLYNQNDQRPGVFKTLLKRIRKEQLHPGVKELWLLGDVFDMVIGNFKFWKSLHSEIFEELKQWTTEGKKVVFVEGNHDFLIKSLLEEFNIEVFENPTYYMLPQSNERVYLAHGDEVEPNKAYAKYRASMRSSGMRWAVNNCPEKLAQKILLPFGENLSKKSRAMNYLDNVEAYKTIFRNHAFEKIKEGARAVFMGHSHFLDQYSHPTTSTHSPFYLNLGSWLEGTYRYGIWDLDLGKDAQVHSF